MDFLLGASRSVWKMNHYALCLDCVAIVVVSASPDGLLTEERCPLCGGELCDCTDSCTGEIRQRAGGLCPEDETETPGFVKCQPLSIQYLRGIDRGEEITVVKCKECGEIHELEEGDKEAAGMMGCARCCGGELEVLYTLKTSASESEAERGN